MAAVRGLLGLAAPLWKLVLGRRLQQGKETLQSIGQKLMRTPEPRPNGPLIWGHAVGVGEAQALIGLFEVMAQRLPRHHFLITTTARTSAQALAGRLPPRCLHQFAPIDTPGIARSFIEHWQPDLAMWCEMDLWPCLLHATFRSGRPRVLVNARLTTATLQRKHRLRSFHAALLTSFDRLYAQDVTAAQGLLALGAPATRVQVAGTIKALARPLPCDTAELECWQQLVADRPIWLAASSHAGEETTLLQAHHLLRRSKPDALLIIAPRYPARGGEVAQQAEEAGFATALRSRGDALRLGHAAYVADTIGEMGLWFRLAPVAFVGGSLVHVGGHNPFEPLALGCRVLHGPTVHNFADSYVALGEDGLTQCVQTAEVVAQAVVGAWDAGRAPALAGWRGAAGVWRMVDELVARAEALNAPPPPPPHPASPPSAPP
jgi:3-deoxy-D-manno-octulosonic-acid transferase